MTVHRFRARLLAIVLLCWSLALACAAQEPVRNGHAQLCATCLRTNLEYLAGPELHGRGSGTQDEYHAAEFIAQKLKEYGVAPAARSGRYIQTATVQTRAVTSPPALSFNGGTSAAWKHGKEIAVSQLSDPNAQGPLQKLDLNDATNSPASVAKDAVVLLKLKPSTTVRDLGNILDPYAQSRAAMVIIPEFPNVKGLFEHLSRKLPRAAQKIDDATLGPSVIFATAEAASQLWSLPDGTMVRLHAQVTPWQTSRTWNVLGKLAGTSEEEQVILLSAHLDHLGVKNGKTYPGADDDASGTVAVMELARALAAGPRPRRTVVFALWGSEEAGMIGSRYFLRSPTFRLKDILANLEFEMIARPDPILQPNQLWLTGWDRTNLGPALAAHGADLVSDPHSEQNFFTRSDNYPLAKVGIVAQTVSSYGLHPDYHQPTDTPAKVDWQHLDAAVASMIGPVNWLANSDFVPTWNAGQKP